jgi:hypothetical protein
MNGGLKRRKPAEGLPRAGFLFVGCGQPRYDQDPPEGSGCVHMRSQADHAHRVRAVAHAVESRSYSAAVFMASECILRSEGYFVKRDFIE